MLVFSSRSLNNGLILPYPDFLFRHYTWSSTSPGFRNHGINQQWIENVKKKKIKNSRDFPGLRLYTSTAGNMGSIPDQGTKIPQAVGQLSVCAIATEPVHRNERPHMAQGRPCLLPLRPDTAK